MSYSLLNLIHRFLIVKCINMYENAENNFFSSWCWLKERKCNLIGRQCFFDSLQTFLSLNECSTRIFRWYCGNPFVSLKFTLSHSLENIWKNHDGGVFLRETSRWINFHINLIFQIFMIQVNERYNFFPFY